VNARNAAPLSLGERDKGAPTQQVHPVRWIVPELERVAPPVTVEDVPPEEIRPPSLEDIRAMEEEARQAGHQAGYAQGLKQGQEQGFAQSQGEMRRLIAQIEGILDTFTRPLARLESEVASALGALAVRIAGHLVARTCAHDPSLLSALVFSALETVGSAARAVEVHLHPDDLQVFSTQMGSAEGQRALLSLPEGVHLVPDPALSRGDLRVHTETMRIDGTLHARLEQALERVMQQAEAVLS